MEVTLVVVRLEETIVRSGFAVVEPAACGSRAPRVGRTYADGSTPELVVARGHAAQNDGLNRTRELRRGVVGWQSGPLRLP